MKNKEAAVAAIRTCKTRDCLDDMLHRFEISDQQESVERLYECMYSPKIFFSSSPLNPDDTLELTKQIFLTGTWRLNEYYIRMGIPAPSSAGVVHG